MSFKNNLKLSFMGCAIVGLMSYAPISVVAQDSYYYAYGEKISLKEDRSTAMVKLQGVAQQSISAVGAMEIHPAKSRAIVHMAKTASAQRMAAMHGVESFNYGYRLADGEPIWVTEEVLVSMKKGTELAELGPLMEKYGAVYSRTDYNTAVLIVKDMKNALPLANALTTSGLVAWSTPNFYQKVKHFNDPLFDQQFQLHNTGQTIQGFPGVNDADANVLEAWGITLGSSNIRVAVVDTGVEPHEDMDDPVAGFTPAGNGNGTPTPTGSAHGQATAGIIVANHNNIGVRGIAPNTSLLAVNIFSGGETVLDYANAINWAVDNGADVICNSWGAGCSSNWPALTDAIRNARQNGRDGKGAIVVFASGNASRTCVNYPGNLPEAIAVGAFNNSGVLSQYSNTGPTLDLVAPSDDRSFSGTFGAGVATTDRMGNRGYTSGNYTTTYGGTSAACPVVAGVACLVLAANPNLTATQVENILYSTAIDMGTPGRDNQYGHGRVNAFAAVSQAIQASALIGAANRFNAGLNQNNTLLKTYPNPVQSQLSIDFAYHQDVTYHAQLVNFMGQVVSEQRVSADANTVDMAGLVPGTYVLRLMADGIGTQAMTKVLRVE